MDQQEGECNPRRELVEAHRHIDAHPPRDPPEPAGQQELRQQHPESDHRQAG